VLTRTLSLTTPVRISQKEMAMNCPVCSAELRMTERQGIEIDYCPGCRGVWLDRGELDKIIDRSSAEASEGYRPPSREHEREYQYDPRYKKKKSLLGELFDF
jgi:Zn-finger nucleic acid-binding protein